AAGGGLHPTARRTARHRRRRPPPDPGARARFGPCYRPARHVRGADTPDRSRPIDPARSTDVGIRDSGHHVRILAECWNTFGDLGAAVRATNRKTAEAAATWPQERIATVWIVSASATNRRLLARYPHILAAAFPGSSQRWVRALAGGAAPPTEPGLVWFDPSTGRLTAHRRAG
ncbi:MAG: hypothetical protein ACTS8Z_07830, partial [Candidatus Limnocylindrales bacterium]